MKLAARPDGQELKSHELWYKILSLRQLRKLHAVDKLNLENLQR